MKKYLFIILAFGAIISCSKDELKVNSEKVAITFTAAPLDGGDTKTYISGGKINWAVGDSITVTNSASQTGVYYIANEGDIVERRVAIFTYKSGTEFSEEGKYTATYGNINDQWYEKSKPGSNCTMCASATVTNQESSSAFKCVFNFTNSCGVVDVRANTGNIVISKIMIGEYTLNLTTPTKLTGDETLLVAVPAEAGAPFSFTDVTFVKSDGGVLKKSLNSAATVRLNQIRKMDTGSYFANTVYELSGVFSVSATQKVHFASGNLQAVYTKKDPVDPKSYSWQFAENQYTVIGNAQGNTTIGASQVDGNIVDLFGWSTNTTYYGISNSDYNTDYSGDFVDWGETIGGGWRTLSRDEWDYLLYSRSNDHPRFARANYDGTRGVILFPDGYTGTGASGVVDGLAIRNSTTEGYPSSSISGSNWISMMNEGCVFLPAGYYRKKNVVNNANFFFQYYSSTSGSIYMAYNLYLHNGSCTSFVSTSYRSQGGSVRLVKNIPSN